MSWNDERVDLLKKLWGEGLSASQIAGRIGGVTRNAVIGKVHRLGLSGRATTSRTSPSRPRNRISTSRRVPKPRPHQPVGNSALHGLFRPDAEPFIPTFEELDIPLAERKTLQDLTEKCCRWPIGDPQTAEFHFCNRDKMNGLPYCETHSRRAFQPPQARRRDRGPAAPRFPVSIPASFSDAAPAPKAKEPVEA
jgi:GcrA cell cycle regulator